MTDEYMHFGCPECEIGDKLLKKINPETGLDEQEYPDYCYECNGAYLDYD